MSALYKYTPEQALRYMYVSNIQLAITVWNHRVLLEGESNFHRVQIRPCVRKQTVLIQDSVVNVKIIPCYEDKLCVVEAKK